MKPAAALPSTARRYHCTVERVGGARASFELSASQSLLHAMAAQGLAVVKVGCRGGGCGVCRVQVLEGQYETMRMSRRHVTEAEQEQGYALACRLLPLGDLVVRPARR